MSNPDIKLEAGLDVSTSRKKIKEDVKKLGNINVPLTGKLNMQKTREQIKKQTSGKNLGAVNLNTNVNTKNVTSSVSKATSQAQKQMSAKPLTFSINKDKLINDIKIIGQQNSRLFKDVNMTSKYNQLLDSAKLATSTKELKTLRVSLSAFKSELKATGNAGLTMGDALKKGLTRATELFGSYGLIMMFSQQLRNAWTEARELDDSMVSLSKVTDELADRNSFPDYLDKSIKSAKELKTSVTDLLYAITEFKKQGNTLEESEILAEQAIVLQNVADVDIDTAISSIKTAMASFDEIGGYTDEQYNSKVTAYSDLINNLSNKFSIDAEGLVNAIRISAGTLTEANTSIEEVASIITAANRYYNDPDYIANTLKIGSLRVRGSKTSEEAKELEALGEDIDGLATSTSKLREEMLQLTGVDIMIDDTTFKSYYQQLLEISQAYGKLDDTTQNNVLEKMFGKNRSSAGASILKGMSDTVKVYEEAINSAGSSQEEFSRWLGSSEAACNEFKVAMTETYSNVLNGETVKALANTGTAILDFANKFGLVESTLRGLIAIGILKGIGTLTTAIKGSVVQVTNLGSALNTVKNLNNLTRGTQQYANAMNTLKASCVGLTDAQLKQVLSNTSLTQSERIKILQYQGLTKAQAQAKLTQLGLTQTTNQQTTANTMATTSTLSLKNAVTGLGASIKASLLSNPIGWAIMAISTAISIATSVISDHNQELEEQRQKTKTSADEANALGDEISELASKYIQLSEAVKTDSSAKEDLLSTQTELLKKLGLEGESVDELIEKYGSLSNAIRQASIDSLKNAQLDLISGVDVAREELLDVGSDGWISGKNVISTTGDGAVKAFKELEKAGLVDDNSIGTEGGVLTLTGDDKTVEGVLENYQKLEDALTTLRDSDAFTADELADNPVYDTIYDRYNEMKTAVEDYNSAITDLNENLAQQHMLSALQGRELPKTQEEFDAFKQSLIETAITSEDFIGTDEDVANAISNYLASVSEFSKFYETLEEDTTKQIFLSFEGSEIGERLQYLTQQFEEGKLTYKEYFDALQNEIDNVDFSNYTDSLEEANKVAQQFFSDSVQQTATGLSDLIDKFSSGSISITEYLEGYTSIANTLSSLTDSLQENSASWDKNGEAIDNATSKALDDTQSKLDSAISTIASYQDSIYSLEQILTQSVEVGSDEFNAHAQVIAQDLENIVASGGLMADEVAKTLGTTTSEIAKSMSENVSNQSLAAQAISANTNTAITNMATAVGELFDSLGEAISNFKVDVTFGVKSITTKTADLGVLGKVQLPAIKFGIEADGESLSAIGDAVSSFGKSVASNFTPQTIDINDYLFGNTESGKNSDYSPSSSILNNYNNALDQIKKSGKETSQVFDWIENKLKSVQRTIANLGKTVSATWKSWTTRNNALAQQISEVNKEISLQQQAYQKYITLAKGVGLSSYYQNLVKNGSINISTITDEGLIDKIKAFEDFYNKALDCQDAIIDLEDELANLAKTKFDNVVSEYENELSMIEHKANIIESSMDILESKGYMVSSQAYDALINVENEELNSLQNKYNSLTKTLEEAMAVGKIEKMSDEWCDMQLEIYKVQEAILESKNALVEYNNTLRDLEWEVFDKLQSKISSITSESDFLIELMSDEKMFDDNGITEHGQATLGLHALNYQTYLAQTKEYASELAQIEEELAKDQYNQDLVDRKSELIKLQQDSILASESELDAIMSLKQEGYDMLLDSLQSAIDKYEELISSQQDMYEYQKKIDSLTSDVSKYQKILDSYSNDDSEESKAVKQKISVELESAKEALLEAEREQSLNDIRKMLDTLESDTQEWINIRLDDMSGVIEEVMAQTEINTDSILETLESETTKVGIALTTEMESIWGSNGTFTVAINNVVDIFKQYFDNLQKASDAEVSKTVTNATSGSSSNSSISSSSASASISSTSSTNNSSSSSGWGSWFVSKTYSKQNLHPETSIVDRLKYKSINADFSYRSQYYRAMGGSGVYTGASSQNNWMLSQMKSHGFAQGGTIGNLIRATGEDGFVLARTGEEILSLDKIKALQETFTMVNPIVNSLAKLPTFVVPNGNNKSIINHNTFEFNMPNVTNGEETVDYLIKSKRFENAILEITDGKGDLGKYKYLSNR